METRPLRVDGQVPGPIIALAVCGHDPLDLLSMRCCCCEKPQLARNG